MWKTSVLSKKVKKGRRGGWGAEVKPTIIFSHRRKTFQYEIYMWKIFDHNHCFEDAQILPQWCKAIFKRKRCFKNQLYQVLPLKGRHQNKKKRFNLGIAAVLFHMHLQITRPFAGVVALLAGKRFLAGVWKHVILHTTVVTARIVALFTSKGLFSSVSELVSLQILRLSGWIVTRLTTERLLSWMDSHANHIILFCSNQGSPPLANYLNQLI